jgi:hypothetical protein
LARLGHPIAASTVRQILYAAGVDAAPHHSGPTRREFLCILEVGAHCLLAAERTSPSTW